MDERLYIPAFNPTPFYEKETDALLFYFRDVRSYEHSVNKHLTVFLGMDDDMPAGLEINGVREILNAIRGCLYG